MRELHGLLDSARRRQELDGPHATEVVLGDEKIPAFPSPCSVQPSQPTSTSPPTAPPPEAEDSGFIKNRKGRWAKLIAQVWHVDPSLCASCGHPMKITAAIGPDQPDVIERILRHLRLWDPPWLGVHKARGPPHDSRRGAQSRPQRAPPGPTETIDPVIPDELYSVDPLVPEDA